VFRYRPHPTDPGRCFFDMFDYARRLGPAAASAAPPSRRTVAQLRELPLTDPSGRLFSGAR
jgi:hypothetical protein